MSSAKPVFVDVRPFQVSHLCFEVGGVLGESFAELGTPVSAFDFGAFYKACRAATLAKAAEHPGRLAFDAAAIDATKVPRVIKNVPAAHPRALAALRAEPLRAALDKAISARANAFITKHGGVAAIADVMRKVIPGRGRQISRLSELSDGLTRVLNVAYENDPARLGAVTETISKSHATVTAGGSVTTTVQNPVSPQAPTTVATQVATGAPIEDNTVTTKNVEFRAPLFENLARNERAQISLGEEIVSFVVNTHYVDHLEEVFANELAAIDGDVNQMQVAYLNTILLSPIDGIVTGVYKNPGDAVSAGEPVFRVENDAVVLIVAKVVCRGPVAVGSFLSIKTTLFDGPGPPVFINATIVAARGHGDDDEWEVIGKVSNVDGAGKRILPLGYHFDNDTTELSIFSPDEI